MTGTNFLYGETRNTTSYLESTTTRTWKPFYDLLDASYLAVSREGDHVPRHMHLR